MKEIKSHPLLILAIFFLVASFIMLALLGYNYYAENKPTAHTTNIAPVENSTDSPQHLANVDTQLTQSGNTATNNDGVSTITTDPSANSTANNDIAYYNRLKKEISVLLSQNSTTAELDIAQDKIRELETVYGVLKAQNLDITNETANFQQQLNELLAKKNIVLTPTPAPTDPIDIQPIQKTEKLIAKKEKTKETVTETEPEDYGLTNTKNAVKAKINSLPKNSSTFVASSMRLTAANDIDEEVKSADATDKFIGSMIVKSNFAQINAEVVVILIQPDGRVVQTPWESGSFVCEDGKKVYTRKLKFDYSSGEERRLNFSMATENIQKGAYTLQVYNKGKLIATAIKVVS